MTDHLEERALALIKTKPRGILQSELWKDLAIDSRKCSRVVAKLEAEGKVKRTWETVSGTRTYRLSYVEPKKEAPKKEYRFDLIMAEGEVAPCVGCTYECEPDYCPDLGNWIELLTREEARKPSKAVPEKIAAKEAAAKKAELPPEAPEVPAVEAEAPKPKPARAKKARAIPEPEEVKPARVKKGKKVEELVAVPAKPTRKARAAPEPEKEPEAVRPVKAARKGMMIEKPKVVVVPPRPEKTVRKARKAPEPVPVKPARAVKKARPAPAPKKVVKPAKPAKPTKKEKPARESKPARIPYQAPAIKPARKAPAKPVKRRK